jgi:hypothetical protein
VREASLLERAARYRFLLFFALAVLLTFASSRELTGDTDWQFFSWGSDLLFGHHESFVRSSEQFPADLPGGLHIYANYPFLQIGPPPLLIARVLQIGPNSGLFLAGAVTQALGLLFVLSIDRAVSSPSSPAGRASALVAGAAVTAAWGSLTHFRHLDDAMTLCATALAVWALTRGKYGWGGALLGVAAASKPWGVVVVALALAAPTRRTRAVAAAAAALVIALFWGPFMLADVRTRHLADVSLYISSDSALYALGVRQINNGHNLRLIQLFIGLALAALLVLLRAWPLAPLAAFSWRLLLEPSAYAYYTTAVVAAALLADYGLVRTRVPFLTSIAMIGWIVTTSTPDGAAGVIRAIEYAGLTAACLCIAVAQRGQPDRAPPLSRIGSVPARAAYQPST